MDSNIKNALDYLIQGVESGEVAAINSNDANLIIKALGGDLKVSLETPQLTVLHYMLALIARKLGE